MGFDFEQMLAPRISAECLPRWKDGYHVDAVRQAWVIVEQALKEKGKVKDVRPFGQDLIRQLFGGRGSVKLRVPFSDDLQIEAEKYLAGAFGYYRNYSHHDGGRIDARIAARMLIVASELLELIDAAYLTLGQRGGIEGLVRIGEFDSPDRLIELLKLLDDYHMPKLVYDGLHEELALKGFTDLSFEAVFELGLIEMHSAEYEDPSVDSWQLERIETVEWLQLTDLGREVIERNDRDSK